MFYLQKRSGSEILITEFLKVLMAMSSVSLCRLKIPDRTNSGTIMYVYC